MSGILAGQVWLSDLPSELKPLAATLADLGTDDGDSIYPGADYVAWRLSSSERTVRRHYAALRELGVLVAVCHPWCVDDPGRGHAPGVTVHYRLDAARLPARRSWAEERVARREPTGDNLAPDRDRGADMAADGGQTRQRRGPETTPDPLSEIRYQIGSLSLVCDDAPLTIEQERTALHFRRAVASELYGGVDAPRDIRFGEKQARAGATIEQINAAIEVARKKGKLGWRGESYCLATLEGMMNDGDTGGGTHGDSRAPRGGYQRGPRRAGGVDPRGTGAGQGGRPSGLASLPPGAVRAD